jgi:hypothetical protein
MDRPDAASDGLASRWRQYRGVIFAVLALSAYAAMLARHVGACAAGPDPSGYLNHARLLAAGNLHAPLRSLPGLLPEDYKYYLFTPLGLVPAPNGNGLIPVYPAGLPLLVVAAAPFFGWGHAGDVVLCAHALLCVLLTYGLGRMMGLSRRGAVVGAIIVGLSPLTVTYSLQMMSDVPSLAWTLGAVSAAWRSRRHAAWALAAGAATAMAVLIRPTNVLVLAPIAVAFGLSPRRWLCLVCGALPGAIFFCVHSLSITGKVFATGYGGFFWPMFRLHWIGVTLWFYACWLPVLFTPAVLLAAGLPWLRRRAPREAAMLGIWALVFLCFYSAYECTHQAWWYLRYLLPAAPPLVVAGLLVVESTGIGRRWRLASARGFTCTLVLLIAYFAVWSEHLMALESGKDSEIYQKIAVWMRANLPDNSVILAMQMTGTLTYYTDFTFVNWNFCHPDNRARVFAAVQASGRPFYAALFSFEKDAALGEHMPGKWTRVATLLSNMEIWRLDSDRTAVPPAVCPPQIDGLQAFQWRLPIDYAGPVQRALSVLNVIAWIVLAWLLFRLLPGHDWRDWLARAGILLSAGALGSIRYGLTDLISLTLLAGAMLAFVRRRHVLTAGLLGAAGLGCGAAIVALPTIGGRPWASRRNLFQWIAVFAVVTASILSASWRLGSLWQLSIHFTEPFRGIGAKWMESISQADSRSGWIGLLMVTGITVQSAFFLWRWHHDEPWWRFGIAYASLMCFLDYDMWTGSAGGAMRILMPLALAFNIFARRCRASLLWLVAGNLAVLGGFFSLFYTPDLRQDMAAIRAAGSAQLSGPTGQWNEVELTLRHARTWSRGSADLKIEAWPRTLQTLLVDFSLYSLVPRTVSIRQGGQELWRGAVGRNYTRVQFSCRLTEGKANLEMATDAAAVAENSKPNARQVAFAIYDPILAVPASIDSR